MFFRYFFVLCMVALVVAAHAKPEKEREIDDAEEGAGPLKNIPRALAPESEDDDTDERAGPAVAILTKIIKGLFASAALNCVTEAANECKSNWKSLSASTNCVKNYFAVNKGRCAVGK